MIDLHFAASPTSLKVRIALEETGTPYSIIPYDLFKGDQLAPEFRAINPNCKLPAIVDHDPVDGGEPFHVFESGAILQYLAEKSGQLLPRDMRGRSRAIQWATWQVAGLGPMIGQANHFMRFAPGEGHEYAIKRYHNETKRLTQVLDNRLRRSPYLAGDEYSIADIACWPIAHYFLPLVDIAVEDYPATAAWRDEIMKRPAIERCVNSPEMKLGRQKENRPTLTREEWDNNFGERMLNAVREA